MACEKMEVFVGKLVDVELTEEERLIVSVHLDTCPACSDLYKDYLRLKSLTADAGKVTAPSGFAAAVSARIDQERANPLKRLWRRLDVSLVRLNRVEIGSLAIALSLVFALVVMPASKLTMLVDISGGIHQKAVSLVASLRQAELSGKGLIGIGGEDGSVGR